MNNQSTIECITMRSSFSNIRLPVKVRENQETNHILGYSSYYDVLHEYAFIAASDEDTCIPMRQ